MVDLNIFGNRETDICNLIKSIKIVAGDNGMVFEINKWGVLIMKKGKEVKGEVITKGNDK